MRSLLDTVPVAYVPLYRCIRSLLVCLSICVRIVPIVYPCLTCIVKPPTSFSSDVAVRDNTSHVHFRSAH
jgi:hypothetical protein